MDADSSQTLAIEEVRRGRNLVIQGPPGTGKSQTIANLIAGAVAGGRKVLFVAEKMAALDVVKRRLDAIGLGAVCLELHSNKANKRAVLDELRRTKELGRPLYAVVYGP
nr:AAA domain-containing protein [Paramagnetospirillum caucaseum]